MNIYVNILFCIHVYIYVVLYTYMNMYTLSMCDIYVCVFLSYMRLIGQFKFKVYLLLRNKSHRVYNVPYMIFVT